MNGKRAQEGTGFSQKIKALKCPSGVKREKKKRAE